MTADLTFVRTSEPGMLGAYDVLRDGAKIGHVSAHYGRPSKSRWRAWTVLGAYSFGATRQAAVDALWDPTP